MTAPCTPPCAPCGPGECWADVDATDDLHDPEKEGR